MNEKRLVKKSRVYLYTVRVVATGEIIQFTGGNIADIPISTGINHLNQIVYVHKEII